MNHTPLRHFMDQLLVDCSDLRRLHPELILVSDNAKIPRTKPKIESWQRPPQQKLSNQGGCRWDPLERIFDKASLTYSPTIDHGNSHNYKGSIGGTYGINNSNETPTRNGVTLYGDSRWTSFNGANPRCAGLTRPSRNASHDDLSSMSDRSSRNAPTKGTATDLLPRRGAPSAVRNGLSSSAAGPIEYKKMSIPKPKVGFNGRTLTV